MTLGIVVWHALSQTKRQRSSSRLAQNLNQQPNVTALRQLRLARGQTPSSRPVLCLRSSLFLCPFRTQSSRPSLFKPTASLTQHPNVTALRQPRSQAQAPLRSPLALRLRPVITHSSISTRKNACKASAMGFPPTCRHTRLAAARSKPVAPARRRGALRSASLCARPVRRPH
jgi:hypothetical protein